jgi:dTDP-4-dehydrorhamnose 3,5-epimerase
MIEIPELIVGNFNLDDRGVVSFVNDFNFDGVRRFYTISNHRAGFIRAWHAHQHETKYVTVLNGTALVGVVLIDNWEMPSRSVTPYRYVLSARKPSVLKVPAGYANGFMTLVDDTLVAFFSTASTEDSLTDDIRFDAYRWDIWKIVER